MLGWCVKIRNFSCLLDNAEIPKVTLSTLYTKGFIYFEKRELQRESIYYLDLDIINLFWFSNGREFQEHAPRFCCFHFHAVLGKIGQSNRLELTSLRLASPFWGTLDPPQVWDQSITLRDLTFLVVAIRWTGHLTVESVVVQVTDGHRVSRTDPVRYDDR